MTEPVHSHRRCDQNKPSETTRELDRIQSIERRTATRVTLGRKTTKTPARDKPVQALPKFGEIGRMARKVRVKVAELEPQDSRRWPLSVIFPDQTSVFPRIARVTQQSAHQPTVVVMIQIELSAFPADRASLILPPPKQALTCRRSLVVLDKAIPLAADGRPRPASRFILRSRYRRLVPHPKLDDGFISGTEMQVTPARVSRRWPMSFPAGPGSITTRSTVSRPLTAAHRSTPVVPYRTKRSPATDRYRISQVAR